MCPEIVICILLKGILIESNPGSYEKVLVNRPYNTDNILAPICPKGKLTIQGRENTATNLFPKESCQAIPSVSMDQLLRERKIEHIQFISLDVAGVELEVLEIVNFEQVVSGVEVHEKPVTKERQLVRDFWKLKATRNFFSQTQALRVQTRNKCKQFPCSE